MERIICRGVHESDWGDFLTQPTMVGQKKIQPNPTQPTWVGLGWVEPMGWTFFNYIIIKLNRKKKYHTYQLSW